MISSRLMTGGKGRDLDSDSTRAPREFRFEGTCSSSFAVVAVRDPPSRVFDDECEGWDPESDLRGLEAGTCLVAPRLSSRVRWWVDFSRLMTGGKGRDPERDPSRDWNGGTRSSSSAVVAVRDPHARSRVLMTSARGWTRNLIFPDWRQGPV